MPYQIYRNTTIGETLQETLAEMIKTEVLSEQASDQVLLHFDRAINKALANKVKTEVVIKPAQLKGYRYCDKVWTLLFRDCEFLEDGKTVAWANKVKVVACDAKSAN